MAKNDKILIDGIIDERIELNIPSNKQGEVFEFFVFEQLLKNYDLSEDEIASGIVDGRNDGGIDGFYIFINGHLLSDTDNFIWPKSGSVLEVWIITCKHHDTFRQAPLDNLVASISELFEFSIENENLKGAYSEELLLQRVNFKTAYRKISSKLVSFKLNFFYASRGDSGEIGDSVKSRAEQLENIVADYFGNCITVFSFCGSTELINFYRQRKSFTLELPFSDYLSSGQTYILLVELKNYYHFISDDNNLKRYLFDSNVRDFMGLNRVNKDIRNTLLNDQSPDFWWLNNGVTILATNAIVIGKSIQINDIQIVNGLQTSESIFRYFSSGGSDINERSVLVKVIVSNNVKDRDEIIRATNNQSAVELLTLNATDKIQRDIEDILKSSDLFYERRTNYYKNQGVAQDKICTPLYIASGFISLILKKPTQATTLRTKSILNEKSYSQVFSDKIDIQVWSKISIILKKTDEFLKAKKPNGFNEHFLKRRRHLLSFLTISNLTKNFNFSVWDLVQLDLSVLTHAEFERCWPVIEEEMPIKYNRWKIGKNIFFSMCRKLAEDHNIIGYEMLPKSNISTLSMKILKDGNITRNEDSIKRSIDPEFINQVELLLPKQPWKQGMHKELALKLGCKTKPIYQAINKLVIEGKIYKQQHGVLYDSKGNIVKFGEKEGN